MRSSRRPGVGLAAFYRHFPERSGLASAVFRHNVAAAVHSGNPAFEPLPAYFQQPCDPARGSPLAATAAAGEIRGDVDALELLHAVSRLCLSSPAGLDHAGEERMVALLIDGLRYEVKSEVRSAERRPRSARRTGSGAVARPCVTTTGNRIAGLVRVASATLRVAGGVPVATAAGTDRP